MKKKLILVLLNELGLIPVLEQIYFWIAIKVVGCYRSVSDCLRYLERCNDKNEVDREIENWIHFCTRKIIEKDYVQDAVRFEVSAAILKYLELSGYDRKKRLISSNPEVLKAQIEDWSGITIDTYENNTGYKYNGKSGNYGSIFLRTTNVMIVKLFQLYFILQCVDEAMETK